MRGTVIVVRFVVWMFGIAAIASGLGGCAHVAPLPPMPQQECDVLVDLVAALDDSERLKRTNVQDTAPSAFPAGPRLNPVATGGNGNADLTACTNLVAVVRDHKRGSIMALRYPDRDGPEVAFSRVTFEPDGRTATVRFSEQFGFVGGDSWTFEMDLGRDGHWKLTHWTLGVET